MLALVRCTLGELSIFSGRNQVSEVACIGFMLKVYLAALQNLQLPATPNPSLPALLLRACELPGPGRPPSASA